ncbi:uncharacterized protein G2W53_007541 [Senna tora]|uniref:Uncharacterized protein n=1 Tax=Senna tora TaxID=362788 RepID=A0A835CF38_9FABA|nr:uncharacterized protein G2W53_006847 [Senna tora]KAF7839059.1 uncharacterized protein G2W53_007541 [Senna tora]
MVVEGNRAHESSHAHNFVMSYQASNAKRSAFITIS